MVRRAAVCEGYSPSPGGHLEDHSAARRYKRIQMILIPHSEVLNQKWDKNVSLNSLKSSIIM